MNVDNTSYARIPDLRALCQESIDSDDIGVFDHRNDREWLREFHLLATVFCFEY